MKVFIRKNPPHRRRRRTAEGVEEVKKIIFR
jgi:hypothetical protein